MNRFSKSILLAGAVATMFVSSRCSQATYTGDEGDSGGITSADFGGNRQDVTGSIASQTGSQSQMQGWVVALLERDSATARVAEADASGILKFSKASVGSVQTTFLLSPDYLVQAVLSMTSTTTNTIKQYFVLNKNTLPQLVHKGGVVNFQSTDAISIQPNNTIDSDGDGIPDGIASLGLNLQRLQGFGLETVDTDKDGTTNETDIDIDGDGLPNSIDSDDDGDGTIDILDTDANGNNVPDRLERTGDQYYSAGLDYVAAQYTVTPTTAMVKFIAKAKEGIKPNSIKIRGPKSLLDGSTYLMTDGTSGGTWDLSLADDGTNEDVSSADSIYGRNVVLASGKSPRRNQVLFFQLAIGSGSDAFTAEYPYLLPSLTPTIPTTSYDSSTRTVTLAGDPFGSDVTGFVWIVTVQDSAGSTVYEGPAVAGATRTFVIPSNIMQSGQTYTYRASAQTLDKVPGYPAIVVRSADSTISN